MHKPVPYALLVLAVLLLWPLDAHAWGPLTHLDYSLRTLGAFSLLAPPMRGLLTRCKNDFIYGSLAADLILGKNMARYIDHCHNWQVGFKVLREAARRGEAAEAFALGFLSHLAADTVAHNYYVPYKVVESFDQPATKHGYWELRFDIRRERETWQVAREITGRETRRHDALLEELLVGQKLPRLVSRTAFLSVLTAVQLKRWRPLVQIAMQRRREHPLTDEQMRECEALVQTAIIDMLNLADQAPCTHADPTGLRNLTAARHVRQRLAAELKSNPDLQGDLHATAKASRASFREAIYGKLVLPRGLTYHHEPA